MSFWKMMAAVPREQTDDDRCVAIWKIVLRALGEIYQSGKPLGQILATEEYPGSSHGSTTHSLRCIAAGIYR